MLNRFIQNMRAKNLFKNDDGVAAIEFALILPLLAILYFGAIEVSFLVQSDRRVTATASTLADLTARTNEMTYCEVEGIFDSASRIIRPSNPGNIRMRITSISVDPVTGENAVDWSQARGGSTSYSNGQEVTVSASLMPAKGSVILAEVEYDYDTPIEYILPSTSTLNQSFILRPRNTDKVTWLGASVTPCA